MMDFSPLPWGEGGESREPGEGSVNIRDCAWLLDLLTSSFVFIDILALFPRFWRSASSGVQNPRSQPPPSGLRPEDVRPAFGLPLYDSATFCTFPLFS
jgi:hypothetical protein